MKQYKVTCTIDAPTFTVEVEATSEEEAKEKAEEMFMNDEIPHDNFDGDSSKIDMCTAVKAEEIED